MPDFSFLDQDDLSLIKVADTSKMVAQQGVILHLHIGRWSANARPTLDELGFGDLSHDEKKKLARIWDLGRFQLLPDKVAKQISRLQQAGYENRRKHCYHIESLGIDFLPAIAYTSWRQQNEQLRNQWFAAVEKMLEDWPQIIEERLQTFAETAETIYRKNRLVDDIPFDVWKTNYLLALRLKYPAQEVVKNKFYWRHTLTHVPFAFEQPTGAAGVMGTIQEEVAGQHNAVLTDFLSEIQEQFYGTVHRTVQNVREKIQKHGHIPGPTTASLRNMISNISTLNVFDDQILEDRMNALKNILDLAGTADRPASIEDINRELTDIEDLLKVQLITADRISRLSKNSVDDMDPELGAEVKRGPREMDAEISGLEMEMDRKSKPIDAIDEVQIEAV